MKMVSSSFSSSPSIAPIPLGGPRTDMLRAEALSTSSQPGRPFRSRKPTTTVEGLQFLLPRTSRLALAPIPKSDGRLPALVGKTYPQDPQAEAADPSWTSPFERLSAKLCTS
jgi:hypothetical protein